ncbi:ImmA/IrrE family metallo-endopeptidase [Chromohalobacter sp. 296-RDG]|uniref:ImmA/IrrE family metallo-endopeptidase n=1 Tax=Chromohalobacter sp. 296-RDG TaxID=2994062 RepID=UPI002468A425|nr:ImmA/IrrE family metallo-endopeptidase [Chromohalobacter sp. 296-RDG]
MARSTAVENARKALDLVWDRQLPVDPSVIANRLLITKEKLPVQMVESSEVGISGKARFNRAENVFICEYSANEVSHRQRFTQAHELGHVILGHVNDGREPKRDTSFAVRSHDPDEVDANAFAAELLMPADYVKTAVKREQDISKLARLFDVSTAAMRFRLQNLRIL